MLDMRDLSFSFDAPVLSNISLHMAANEFVALLGPSGCGKTTLLRLAAGALRQTSGEIRNAARTRAFVFQEPRLAPWLDAIDNAAFGLKALGASSAERRRLTQDILLRLGLAADDLHKRPAALSGGMRQRVAVARALAVRPQMLLMDEPFAALDVGLRRGLQDILAAETADSGATTLFVTHDVTEAVRLASRIVVLSPRPAAIVADLPNAPVRDPALIHEQAAALLRRAEVAGALFPSDTGSAFRTASSEPLPARNCLRCERWDCCSS